MWFDAIYIKFGCMYKIVCMFIDMCVCRDRIKMCIEIRSFSQGSEGAASGAREGSTASKVSLIFYSLDDVTCKYGKMFLKLGGGCMHVH